MSLYIEWVFSWVLPWIPEDQDKHKLMVRAMMMRAVAKDMPRESLEWQAVMKEATAEDASAREYYGILLSLQ